MKTHTFTSNGTEFLMVEKTFEGQADLQFPSPTMDRSGKVSIIERISSGRKFICSLGKESDIPNAVILGIWHTRTNEIDFVVQESFVKTWMYGYNKLAENYLDSSSPFVKEGKTKQSFLSLLKSEASKVWVKENPYGEELWNGNKYATHRKRLNKLGCDALIYDEYKKQWQEAESRLLPEKILLIKIEK